MNGVVPFTAAKDGVKLGLDAKCIHPIIVHLCFTSVGFVQRQVRRPNRLACNVHLVAAFYIAMHRHRTQDQTMCYSQLLVLHSPVTTTFLTHLQLLPAGFCV